MNLVDKFYEKVTKDLDVTKKYVDDFKITVTNFPNSDGRHYIMVNLDDCSGQAIQIQLILFIRDNVKCKKDVRLFLDAFPCSQGSVYTTYHAIPLEDLLGTK